MSDHAVEIYQLSFAYPDGTQALDNVSFSVPRGGSVGIIGPNGAGKSTMLLHLNAYLKAQSGKVFAGGVEVNAETSAHARRAVGLVFQDPDDQLFMPTVFEDVAFGPINAGFAAEEVERCAINALDRVGALHLRERPPYRLSGGEKRSVAIATALALLPEILVMDEPSSGLDPRGRRCLIELLQSLAWTSHRDSDLGSQSAGSTGEILKNSEGAVSRSNTATLEVFQDIPESPTPWLPKSKFGEKSRLELTKIIATHDLELVVEVCSSVIVLDSGRIVAQGSVSEILNNEPLMLAHGLERPHIMRHRHPH